MNEKKLLSRYDKGQQTKNHIIRCAFSLFEKKGYNNVSVNEIIEEANSSKGAFYNHFQSKDDLVIIMIQSMDMKYKKFVNSFLKDKNCIDSLYQFGKYFFTLAVSEIGYDILSALYISQVKGKHVSKYFLDSNRYLYQFILTKIKEGQANKTITIEYDSNFITKLLINNIRGTVYDWCIHEGKSDIILDGCVNLMIFLKGIGVSEVD